MSTAKTLLDASNIALDLLSLANNAVAGFTAVSAVISKAQSEGRSDLTDDEWASLDSARAKARSEYEKALAALSAPALPA